MRIVDGEIIQSIKQKYPSGTRVMLIEMEDSYSKLVPGSEGTVSHVDDIGTIHVTWDCRSSLGIVYGIDACKKIDE